MEHVGESVHHSSICFTVADEIKLHPELFSFPGVEAQFHPPASAGPGRDRAFGPVDPDRAFIRIGKAMEAEDGVHTAFKFDQSFLVIRLVVIAEEDAAPVRTLPQSLLDPGPGQLRSYRIRRPMFPRSHPGDCIT